VDHVALLRLLDRGVLPAVLLVHGPDAQALDDVLAVLGRHLFHEPSAAAFDRQMFDARETDVESVIHAALTVPVLAPRRLVAVRHVQAWPPREAEALARYTAAPSPTTSLLLLADEVLAAGRDRPSPHWLLAAVPTAAQVEVSARRGRALEDWLRQRAQAEGVTLTEEAARLLVQMVGEDSARLLGEARKAALAGGPDNRAVGVREVESVVGEHRVSGLFDLTRAIERREVGGALRTLDRLLATEEPLFVLAALTREVRAAWLAREAQQRGLGAGEIARRLRRPPPVVEALLAALAGESTPSLALRLRRCWQAEWRVKSGGEPRAELTALVTELCRGGAR
jgi:DNA polymerase-3 subunit delta